MSDDITQRRNTRRGWRKDHLVSRAAFFFLKVKDESSEVINGTFRSMKCLRTADAGTFSQEMCSAFKAIPNLPSFKKRLLLRSRSSNDEGERILDKI